MMRNGPTDSRTSLPNAPDAPGEGSYRAAYRKLLRSHERDQRILWHFQYFELQLIRSQDLGSLLQLLLEELGDYFKLGWSRLVLLDDEGTVADIFRESTGKLPDGLAFSDDDRDLHKLFPGGVKLRRLTSGQDNADGETGRDLIYLPLVRQGALVGCLQLAAGDETGLGQVDSSDRLVHFAAVVAICLENCVNRERLRLHTLIDALTGVRNRRGFEESLEKETARARRTGQPLTAMFVDLDHFKRVNDQYGHPCGDRVLIEVVRNIAEVLRPTDMLSRYGGEEFIALLPACDDQQATGIARRINRSVAAQDLYDDNGDTFRMTCSIGFSSWLDPAVGADDSGALVERLILQADKAVYRAKQEGRDRACYIPL